MIRPPDGEDWVALSTDELPIGEACAWAVTPGCGALVVFCGTVRDHAPGRPGVEYLEYQAYEEQVEPKLTELLAETRRRFPVLGRLAALHRTGRLAVGETSVLVLATSPSRPEAFAATRFLIDALKATVPIWKHETWDGGSEWSDGTCVVEHAHELSGGIQAGIAP